MDRGPRCPGVHVPADRAAQGDRGGGGGIERGLVGVFLVNMLLCVCTFCVLDYIVTLVQS